MSLLEDELNDLEDDLDDAENLVGEQTGPLDPETGASLKTHLDTAEGRIDTILDPNQSPSLDPPDAGSPVTSVNPDTLPKSAQACHELAEDAQAEIKKPSPDHDGIGSKLKTIKLLLPDYRERAGIT